jgi:hypothetical protein
MITAANLFGLYSAFRACKAIVFKSSLHSIILLVVGLEGEEDTEINGGDNVLQSWDYSTCVLGEGYC